MYSEQSQISKLELCLKIVNGWKLLIFFARSSILDVRLGSDYASGLQIDMKRNGCGSRTAAASKMELFVITVNGWKHHRELHLGCCSSPRSASGSPSYCIVCDHWTQEL